MGELERLVCGGRRWLVLAAFPVAVAAPGVAVAAQSNDDLAAEVRALQAQLREMKSTIAKTRKTARQTQSIVAAASTRPVPPPPANSAAAISLPAGAVPVFVTEDKSYQFGAITITPGGFIAAESVLRSRTTQSDMDTSFTSIPFGNNPLAHANEFRFSARQTRIALLAEALVTPTFGVSGYVELDFRGAANTANSNESNSFNPRIRNLYATLDDAEGGWHLLAGQSWSLAVLNSRGITPRNEVTPGVIDGKYVPGFVSPRQPGVRLTKNLDDNFWLSISAEQSQTTFATACPAGTNVPGTFGITGTFDGNSIGGINCSALGTGGGFAGNTNNFSLNHVPDVIGKVAYEYVRGDRDIHTEVFGLYRDFYDRVAFADAQGYGQNVNRNTAGYGVGAGLIVPIIPRKLDFQVSGIYGRGIGRYGTTQLPDTTFNADGSLRPIREGMLLGGLIVHATPAIDVYSYAGIDKQFRTYTYSGNDAAPFYGLGAPVLTADTSSGCGLEANALSAVAGGAAANPCAGQTKQIFQVTGGLWDNIYRGSLGQLRVGLQYSFTERQIFNTAAGYPSPTASINNYQPKAYDHIVFTSLRYFPFY